MTDPSIILDIEPDWGVEPEVSYSFTTVVQDTPYFVEQRRPLLVSPIRSANYKFTESNEQFQRLCNTLVEAKDQQICVPIFSEPIFAASIVTGGSSITATTSLTYLWNINHCSYVVLLNFVTGESEMIGVTSVSGQLIRLATNIVGVWIAAQTVIFPAMAAELVSMKQSFATDSIGSIEAEFSESALGAEATGSWVGLDEQTCCEQLTTQPCSNECSHTFDGTGSGIDDTFWYGDPDLWNRVNGEAILSMYQDPPVWQVSADVWTQFEFNAEYDVQINWTLENVHSDGGLAPNGGYFNFFATEYDAGFAGIIWGDQNGEDPDGVAYQIIDPDTSNYVYVQTADRSGKLRITRDGSGTAKFYYWNSSLSRWEWNGDTDGVVIATGSTSVTSIYLNASVLSYNGKADSSILTIDNFCVNSGCDNITTP